MSSSFLPNHGGYRQLLAYQLSEIVFDITYHFTHRFLEKGDRTIDQMIQAARSGKQNIAEGSRASVTSCETEIKLTNVAMASLEELLLDYEDYLRVRGLSLWDKTHPRYERMRLYAKSERFKSEYSTRLSQFSDEELANLCITLIHQTTYLLRRLLNRQQQQFVEHGGIREQMTRARLNYRRNNPPTT